MRHTLIPKTLRKALRHEYRVRASVVLLFMLSLAGVIGIVSLMPAFIHAMLEKSAAEKVLVTFKSNVGEDDNAKTSKEAEQNAKILALFNSESKNSVSYVSFISDIVGARGNTDISSVNVSMPDAATVTTVIQGVAPSRESLLSFKSRLEALREGNKVDLPVSELAKSSDIRFSLTVTSTIKQ